MMIKTMWSGTPLHRNLRMNITMKNKIVWICYQDNKLIYRKEWDNIGQKLNFALWLKHPYTNFQFDNPPINRSNIFFGGS